MSEKKGKDVDYLSCLRKGEFSRTNIEGAKSSHDISEVREAASEGFRYMGRLLWENAPGPDSGIFKAAPVYRMSAFCDEAAECIERGKRLVVSGTVL
jgi:hypothetical protein